jgi:hypothetical protein
MSPDIRSSKARSVIDSAGSEGSVATLSAIESLPITRFLWGAGIECSFLPHLGVDQFKWTQHDRFWREDLALVRVQRRLVGHGQEARRGENLEPQLLLPRFPLLERFVLRHREVRVRIRRVRVPAVFGRRLTVHRCGNENGEKALHIPGKDGTPERHEQGYARFERAIQRRGAEAQRTRKENACLPCFRLFAPSSSAPQRLCVEP